MGLLSLEERAKVASTKLASVAQNNSIPLSEFKISNFDSRGTTEIVAGKDVTFSVFDADAKASNTSRVHLAEQYLESIKKATANYREVRTPKNLLFDLSKFIAATIALLVVFKLIQLVCQFIFNITISFARSHVRSLRLGGSELISSTQIIDTLDEIVNGARFLLFFTVFLIYFQASLSFFPWTRSVSNSFFKSILSAVGQILGSMIGYTPNLVFICVVSLFTFYTLKFVKYIFTGIKRGRLAFQGFDPVWSDPTARIIQTLVIALVAVVIFPYLPGSGSSAFEGISIFLGVLISLGSSSVIANIVAGIFLTYIRSFNIGEEVELGDVSGVVIEKGLLVTRILTGNNYYVNIPNSKIIDSNVTRFRASGTKTDSNQTYPILSIEITIGYDTLCSKVHEILLAAASEVDDILPEPAPGVAQTNLSALDVSYSLYFRTDNHPARGKICSDLYREILDKCTEEGIALFRPQFVALLDGIAPPSNAKLTEPQNASHSRYSKQKSEHFDNGH